MNESPISANDLALLRDQMAFVWGNPQVVSMLAEYAQPLGACGLEIGGGMGLLSGLMAAHISGTIVSTDVSDYDGAASNSYVQRLLQVGAPEIHSKLEVLPAALQSAHDRVTFKTCSAESLPFESEQFDFAFSCNAFEHIRDPKAALKEILRVLKPGGRAFIQFSPIFTADDGSHLFGQSLLDVPWCVLIHTAEEIEAQVAMRGLPTHRVRGILDALNGHPPAYYRDLFENCGAAIEYQEEFCGYVLADATSSPEYEKALALYSAHDLSVLGFKAYLQKPMRKAQSNSWGVLRNRLANWVRGRQ